MSDGGAGFQDVKHVVLSHAVAAVDLQDLIKSEDLLNEDTRESPTWSSGSSAK